MSIEPRCENCRFYDDGPHTHPDKDSECRRNAPVILSLGMSIGSTAMQEAASRFPAVAATDWCGEFDPKSANIGYVE